MPAVISYIALVLIAGMVSLVFLIAWRAFERSPHVLIWSIAFALAAVMWAIELAIEAAGPRAEPHSLALVIEGFAAAAIAIGFRYRAGRFRHVPLILGAATAQAVASGALALGGAATLYRPLPLILFDAAMFFLAARSLTGRRRSERAAERVAASGLIGLSLINLATFGLTVADGLGADIDAVALDRAWTVLLPAIVAGIGMFTIFLIAADLADRTRRLAAIDMQTGLLNRRGLEEAVGAIMDSVKRNRRSMALALIDIDRFKAVNDRFGHSAGDRLIEAFGQCLRASVQRRDLVARIGGEEFAIIMTDVDAGAALCAAEVLRDKVAQLQMDFDDPHDITASFGLTNLQQGDRDFHALFARADRALYQSKAAGRNRTTLAA